MCSCWWPWPIGHSLLLLLVWIAWEAIGRLREPSDMLAGPMLLVAAISLVVNLVDAQVLWRGNRGDGNLKEALLHVVGNLLGSVGAIGVAIGILLTGWTLFAPLLSVRVLLQAMSREMDAEAAGRDILSFPEVAKVGHFHAWTLTEERTVATMHVTPSPGVDPLALPALVAARLLAHHALRTRRCRWTRLAALPRQCIEEKVFRHAVFCTFCICAVFRLRGDAIDAALLEFCARAFPGRLAVEHKDKSIFPTGLEFWAKSDSSAGVAYAKSSFLDSKKKRFAEETQAGQGKSTLIGCATVHALPTSVAGLHPTFSQREREQNRQYCRTVQTDLTGC